MSIEFRIENDNLYLLYSPRDGNDWVSEKFNRGETVRIRRNFFFKEKDLENDFNEDNELEFLLGKRNGKYFSICKKILDTKQNILISETYLFKNKYMQK